MRDIFSSYSDLYDVLKSSDFRIERFEVFMKYLFIWGCNTERKNPHSLVDAGVSIGIILIFYLLLL